MAVVRYKRSMNVPLTAPLKITICDIIMRYTYPHILFIKRYDVIRLLVLTL